MTFDRVAYKKAYRQKNADAIRKYDREYRLRTAAQRLEYARRYRSEHLEQRHIYFKKWNDAHFAQRKVYARRSILKRTYGLSEEAYAALLLAQGGGCGICGITSQRRQFNVDHDHVTNEVRGLLCDSCNLGIGQMGDSPERFEAAAAYLRKKRG